MKLGIVGLPNVGKSTLFNAITNAGAQSENYPFCTIDPNIGVVSVPDGRLNELAKLYDSEKVTPATIEFVDIAGLVKGASKGEGLGNKFLSHIRQVDAIVHVVRCFENDNIVHVQGGVDPERDVSIINLELILSDIDVIQRRIEKINKLIKTDKKYKLDLDFFSYVKDQLDKGVLARSIDCSDEQKVLLDSADLLTSKPVIFAANMDENDFRSDISSNKYLSLVERLANKENAVVLPICAEIEAEISDMTSSDKEVFLKDIGLAQSGLERLISKCYDLLGLISFLTSGKQETRAWTIKKGTKAPQAAGKIHSDIERGFIRAEIIKYDDLIECGSMSKAKEKGLIRSEGKDYVIQDGDVALFRFNV